MVNLGHKLSSYEYDTVSCQCLIDLVTEPIIAEVAEVKGPIKRHQVDTSRIKNQVQDMNIYKERNEKQKESID
jgi:hypothetical protein